MNHLLSNGNFEAVRWFDGCMTKHEPLYEVFEDEPATGMKVYSWYELDDGCNFGIMESNLALTTHTTDKIGCVRNYWDYKTCAECRNYAETVDIG